jgi:hypothetical protein
MFALALEVFPPFCAFISGSTNAVPKGGDALGRAANAIGIKIGDEQAQLFT